MRHIKLYENFESKKTTLLIIDVQKSFKKFFNEMYLNELKKYCNNFSEVYQIFDNHVDGKNVDQDYLHDENPEIPVNGDLYTFPNQVDIIEKRYRYDVDVNFFKNKMSKEQFEHISNLERNNQIKIGDYFEINNGVVLFYIGNNHKWFECPKKLYNLLNNLVDREVTIVGGSDSECLQDIFISAESLGVKIKRDWKYIWSANHCPIG